MRGFLYPGQSRYVLFPIGPGQQLYIISPLSWNEK